RHCMLFNVQVPAILPEFGSSLVVEDELLQLCKRNRKKSIVIAEKGVENVLGIFIVNYSIDVND
ncbi:MAG: hypothetical protein ABI778_05470, partial [Ignavibacteriota bacterium]